MRERNVDNEKKKPSKKVTHIYQKPKILLIDLPDTDLDSVRSAGFNASSGTFGSPYKVKFEYDYQPIIHEAYLPNFTEQEIIIIDLTAPETIDSPESERVLYRGDYDWWAKGSRGKIDPRPMVMMRVRYAFDRILDHDGMFVIFAQPRLYQKLVWANNLPGYIPDDQGTQADNWSFLSILSHIEIKSDVGEEIIVPNQDHQLFRFLRNAIKDAMYTATFKPTPAMKNSWAPIVNGKFKECVVGGLLAPENSKGRILILPQISKDADTIVTLLREVLPELSPHLFPHMEGLRWVERDEYELDSVLKYKTDKVEVRERANRDLEDLDKKITEERDRLGFLHGIITNTGDDLVESVKSCLEFIGFEQVIDVDKQIQNQATSAPKQEDLQVHDKSPTLLLEIKGLSGLPHESDTLQVAKYIQRRMKEWNRTEVRGVSMINHQRNVPALERDNQNVFTAQQIEDTQHNGTTILTTWDLFLLTRGMMKWKWNPKAVQDLFYQSGRMPKIPTIYKPIGKIVNYWEKIGVVGVQISENKLHKGERIGYVTPEGYLEEEVSSLQVKNQDVEETIPGQLVGIKTRYPKNFLRKGTIVCVVKEK